MLRSINKIKFNIVLALLSFVFALLVIVWNNHNYQLYQQIKSLSKQNHQIVAMNKQLLSKHSEKISGKSIEQTAKQKLQMIRPIEIKEMKL